MDAEGLYRVMSLMARRRFAEAEIEAHKLQQTAPQNWVYGVCAAGFAAMAWRALGVARVHWQRGYSVLERPESTMQDR